MSNKALIVPQLDTLLAKHQHMIDLSKDDDYIWAGFHKGWIDAIKQFRLMLEGIDVTEEVDNG